MYMYTPRAKMPVMKTWRLFMFIVDKLTNQLKNKSSFKLTDLFPLEKIVRFGTWRQSHLKIHIAPLLFPYPIFIGFSRQCKNSSAHSLVLRGRLRHPRSIHYVNPIGSKAGKARGRKRQRRGKKTIFYLIFVTEFVERLFKDEQRAGVTDDQ